MKYFILAAAFLLPSILIAQSDWVVTGKIIDKNTGTPLQGASVFAQNTTFGEASKSDGTFSLKLPSGGYDLIVTYTGYETFVTRITSTGNTSPLVIELKEKEKALQEVSIVFTTEVKDGWQKYGSFFIDNFIGKTHFAKETELKNPEVLKFFYSKKRNRLKVTAEQPLIVVNKGLGYNIKYAIDSFVYEYATNTNTFVGYPLFEEMNGSDEQKVTWQDNRRKVYKGSIIHFMRSFYNRFLTEEGFEIQYIVSANGNESAMKVKDPYDALNYNKDDTTNIVEFSPNQSQFAIIYNKAKPEPAYFQYDPTAKKDFRISTMTINPDLSIGIEKNGYYFEQADIIINGYWSFEKVGNMLPYDYHPPL